MSLKASRAAWAAKINDPQAKLVLLKLADCDDEKRGCYPLIDSIAASTELSERTVRRKIEMLEAGGWITRKRQKRGTSYTLNFGHEPDTVSGLEAVTVSGQSGQPDRSQAVTVSTAVSLSSGQPDRSNRTHSPVEAVTVSALYRERPRTTIEREREERAPTTSPAKPRLEEGDEWEDTMPRTTANELTQIQTRINSMHPAWRPAWTYADMQELRPNASFFMSLTAADWALLGAYMDAAIPDGWLPKPYQPDSRSRFIRDISDILTHADKWQRRCNREGIPTGIPKTKNTDAA